MKKTRSSLFLGGLALSTAAFLSLSAAILPRQEPADANTAKSEIMRPEDSKALKAIAASKAIYVGASKCKSCHNKDSMGKVYDKWTKMKHYSALENLKSEDAIRLGKENGIDKPWEADACLKCHITAYTEPAERRHKRFKMDKGVQCESCHGPGSLHVKARLKAAKEGIKGDKELIQIPEGEIVLPDEGLCRNCHNEESPSYKEFDFGERLEKIRHLHPLRKEPRVHPPKKDDDAQSSE